MFRMLGISAFSGTEEEQVANEEPSSDQEVPD